MWRPVTEILSLHRRELVIARNMLYEEMRRLALGIPGEFNAQTIQAGEQCFGLSDEWDLASSIQLAVQLSFGNSDFELARLEPALGLISMTFGTAPVLARMVGIDLGAARITAPEVPAERFGATGHDVGDGASMRSQHRRAPFASIMSRHVVVRETAEDVRNLDHGRYLPSQAGHQLVEDAF